MLLLIDKNKAEPIFQQLIHQIKYLIENGDLKEGFQMPSSRQLATSLGINRSTVIRAYEELWSLGYLDSTPGSFTRVRKRKILKSNPSEETANENFWENSLVNNFPEQIYRPSNHISDNYNKNINFHRLEPDVRLINKKSFSICYNKAINETNYNIFGYCQSQGYKPLRQVIASHMRLHSVNVTVDNILITNGSQNSLQLIFQAFVGKDDIIAVESPTYSMLIPLARFSHCKIIEIPVNNDGLDINILKKHLKKNKIKMLFTMPTFQNPTAITMPQNKREELLSICEKNSIILIEDSIEEELKYFGKVHLPIKSIDHKNIVIYLGTFSKVLSPGLRLGWIIADKECIRKLTALKTIFDLSTNTFSQVLIYHFCNLGYYELHLRKCLRAFRKRMKVALKALKQYLPSEKASWNEPLGGFLIWVKIKINAQNINIEDHLSKFGVSVVDGKNFFIKPTNETFIRISISNCNESEIEEGIKRIGIALNAIN